ncbi:MAG: DUF4422 domain-containing protein [Suilimivivens sp.]
MKEIAIYGAGMVAVSVYYALKTLYPSCNVISFIVSRQKGNPAEINGIPVVIFADFERTDVTILVATPENLHAEIQTELKQRQLQDTICIDSKTEAALMEHYYQKTDVFQTLRAFSGGDKRPEIAVYASCFYKDKPLKNSYHLPDWVEPIQAGAALTDIRVAALRDDEGDNISAKNVNYSELSAMYWIGKHADSDYLGLFHYRRILDVTEEDLYRISENDIDVILPYPTIHYPNIYEHHKRYLKEQDWQAMLQALSECAPSYAEKLPAIFEGQYFYNYNMLIAKRQVFRDYCNWLFPILKRTEELSVPKGNQRADRYIGYLGENLTTLYFMIHKDDLKIAHTGRLMLT